ncbi:MAG TPA: CRISPR-associated endonuclease Cas2 [Spirochaetota bacterium]|nr:CRISPR-associated endonuclease Cas2 [Spirochaetota bacterium]HOM11551.1 CRISPR-associated endonuclease Cas2 [Spirochaetota bacterium]HPP51267.1 CRISPR-associated endonuclease Cas2 [Spirochaetota bacterium]HXK66622.1 CRISPR-associated endonuclease Cas2 [Spirochaetota bacterium]
MAKQLERMGIRVQYSFFNVELDDEMLDKLMQILLGLIDPKEDKIYVYPLCTDCCKKVIIDGTGALLDLNTFIIL